MDSKLHETLFSDCSEIQGKPRDHHISDCSEIQGKQCDH